jgi:hypothetical protein
MKRILTIAAVAAAMTATQAWATLEISILEGTEGHNATINWSGWDESDMAAKPTVYNGDPDNQNIFVGVNYLTAPWDGSSPSPFQNDGVHVFLLFEYNAEGQKIWSDSVWVAWTQGGLANTFLRSDPQGEEIPLEEAPWRVGNGPLGYNGVRTTHEIEESPGIMTFGVQYGIPFNVNIQSEPVPEPTTIIAGALLLLPFGLQSIRILRNRRQMA